MSEKKVMTTEEVKQLVAQLTAQVPQERFVSFIREHEMEIKHEVQIILLLIPAYRTLMTDEDLLHAARIVVWVKHNRDDDDWKRPPRPETPKPLSPSSGGRILERV